MTYFIFCYLAIGVFIALCFLDEITSDAGLDLLDEASPSARMQAPKATSFFVVAVTILVMFAWPVMILAGKGKSNED